MLLKAFSSEDTTGVASFALTLSSHMKYFSISYERRQFVARNLNMR